MATGGKEYVDSEAIKGFEKHKSSEGFQFRENPQSIDY